MKLKPPSPDAAPKTVPSVLLSYQAEAVALSHQHDLFVGEKSRRVGFTYGFASDGVLVAAPAIRAMDVMYIGTSLDMAREFITSCGDFTKAFHLASPGGEEFLYDDASEKGIKALRIDLPSGYSVVALSSRPRSIRGRQGLIIIDEAAFHDDLDELLKAALAMLMWGGRVVVTSTHNGEDNAFNQLIQDIRAGKREGYVYRLTLKDALAQGLYQRICLVNGKEWSPEAEAAWEAKLRKTYGDAAEEELDVIPSKGSGVYLPAATIDACMSPDHHVVRLTLGKEWDTAGGLLIAPDTAGTPIGDNLRAEVRTWREAWLAEWIERELAPHVARFDPHRPSFWGQDFARTNDLSTIAAGQEDAACVLHNRLGIEMRNVPFWAQFAILCWLSDALPLWAAGKMDARGNGQQLAEDMQEKYGADRVEAVMATEAVYLARMPRMKARFEDRTILIPRDEGIKDDLRQVKLVRGVPKIVDRVASKEDGAKGKRHGDYAIAVMNLVGAADEDVQPVETHTADQPRSMGGDYEQTDTGFGTVRRRADFGRAGDW
ncbi:terminase family protein [Sphingomonas sp.]|uniref:terminase large subunit domain-containing protein n=1 Tax=Sphingomonas sp. TaxID=28214 RepID=UPI0031E21E8C